MGSSLGFLLTLFLLIQGMAFAGDLCVIQIATSSLQGAATTAVRYISAKGAVDETLRNRLFEEAQAVIDLPDRVYQVGELLTFSLRRNQKTLFLSEKPLVLTIRRSLVVGYR